MITEDGSVGEDTGGETGMADADDCTESNGGTETCDGRDNDCDGEVDEGLTRKCGLTDGVCAGATVACTDGSYPDCGVEAYGSDYVETETSDECDTVDNDCDGEVDEECECKPGETQPCGKSKGACVVGIQDCQSDGTFGACEGSIGPSEERCDGKDNDCDGKVDEELTRRCGTDLGICQSGTEECSMGSWGSCQNSKGPEDEVCDTKDNDCDGKTDENSFVEVYGGASGMLCGEIATPSGAEKLYCWGNNYYGQVGDGTTDSAYRPVAVATTSQRDFDDVGLGGAHTCGSAGPAGVFCWGANFNGSLGDGTTDQSKRPTTVNFNNQASTANWSALEVAAGARHTCAVVESGSRPETHVECWGKAASGQLGHGSSTGDKSTPVQVNNSTGFHDLAVGANHSCALDKNNAAQCWGANGLGQLGGGPNGVNQAEPTDAYGSHIFSTLEAADKTTCGLEPSGQVRCWGENTNGEIGDGTTMDRTSPTTVKQGAVSFEEIEMAKDFVCGRTSGNEVYCWGSAEQQIGTFSSSQTPERVLRVSNNQPLKLESLALGEKTLCGLTTGSAGNLLCVGWGRSGQLGNGLSLDAKRPEMVSCTTP